MGVLSPPPRRVVLSLGLLVVVALVVPTRVHAILPTAALDIYVEKSANWVTTTSTSSNKATPDYTLLASQASFGSYPSMEVSKNPVLTVVLPPSDNPLLCHNVTKKSSKLTDNSNHKNSKNNNKNLLVLVPRGDCTFESKAWHAQQLGASAIVIYGTLSSRYSYNETDQSIIYPKQYYDYDCSKGMASIPVSALHLQSDNGGYEAHASQNDAVLSNSVSPTENLCLQGDAKKLQNCPSKACLLTGNYTTPHNAQQEKEMQACCAWDLHIWLYGDAAAFRNNNNNNSNNTSNSNHNNKNNEQDERVVTIPAAYITLQQAQPLLQAVQGDVTVSAVLYARWRSSYNLSSIVIWLVGVLVCAAASYRSAGDYHSVQRRILHKRRLAAAAAAEAETSSPRERSPSSASQQQPRRPLMSSPPEESMELTAEHALGFIVMASTSLLVLFYFKIYNVVKVMYALGCSKAVTNVLMAPALTRLFRQCNWRNNVVFRTHTEDFGDITVIDIASHVAGYALGLAWIVTAFTSLHPEELTFFWVTQDIFGACMCCLFLQTIQLNSIRVATILLVTAFLYDIFFVFVTPLLFQGKSVMITVATSGGPPTADPAWCEKYPADKNCQGGNPLPMLLTIPRLEDYQGGSSLLGLGDIVLPGLLLSFAARYDAAKSLLGILQGGTGSLHHRTPCPEAATKHSACLSVNYLCSFCCCCTGGYFLPLVIAYAIGLFMANAAVYYMQMGQPALLYLVPTCLGTFVWLAHARNEWNDVWLDPKCIRAADTVLYGDSAVSSTAMSMATASQHQPLATSEEMLNEDNMNNLGGDEHFAMSVPSAMDEYEDFTETGAAAATTTTTTTA